MPKLDKPAKLTGTVIDAMSRRPIAQAIVKISRTAYSEETDRNGIFVYDGLQKGKVVTISCSKRGYKPATYPYRANVDEEQNVTIKMGPVVGRRR